MSYGIVYLLAGPSCAERLVVSIHTLRKHYAGPLAVFCSEEESARAIAAAAKQFVFEILPLEQQPSCRHGHYCLKPRLCAKTPFDRTLYLDADTVILGPLTDLMRMHAPLVATAYSDWTAAGKRISGRLRWFKGRGGPQMDWMIEEAIAQGLPCINSGVFAWDRWNTDMAYWGELTDIGQGVHMTDEVGMQLLLSTLTSTRFLIADDRWNCSPWHGKHQQEVVVWHFHGQKHLRRPEGQRLWKPHFFRALAENAGGLADWAGKYDKWVRELLKDSARVAIRTPRQPTAERP